MRRLWLRKSRGFLKKWISSRIAEIEATEEIEVKNIMTHIDIRRDTEERNIVTLRTLCIWMETGMVGLAGILIKYHLCYTHLTSWVDSQIILRCQIANSICLLQ